MKQRAYDILGNVAVVNFHEKLSVAEKKKFAEKILKENLQVKTVVEKVGKFSGRLRKMKTKFLIGEKTKEVLYKENGCVFRFNLDSTYFSPRLSNERREIASFIKKDENALVMFAGVGPFSVVIAKNSNCRKVYSNEINRKANKYGKLNIELNKLKGKVELIPGDIKKVVGKLRSLNTRGLINSEFGSRSNSSLGNKINSETFSQSSANRAGKILIPQKFDAIIMPRPQLKDSFLKEAFVLSKKGTRIFYYDFCRTEEKEIAIERVKFEAQKCKKKIKILKVKEAGETAPYKVRLRVDFVVLN